MPSFRVKSQNTIPHQYNSFEKIGAIPFDPELDDPGFQICDELNIQEYYQVGPKYKEGLKSIKEYLLPQLEHLNGSWPERGLIVIRFVVNCNGIVGRSRITMFDEQYNLVENDYAFNEVLRTAIHKMQGWEPGKYQGKNYDSYQLIKLRIEQHEIRDIFF